MSIRFRINLVITLIMLIFCIVITQIIISDFKRSIYDEMEASTKITIKLLETVLINSNLIKKDPLVGFLNRMGRVRANEIKFFDTENNLLYESPPSKYKKGRWAPNWFAKIVEPKLTDFRLNIPQGSILITPNPSRSILDAWDEIKKLFIVILLFYSLLSVTFFWLLGKWLKPLQSIVEGLSSMREGNFETRLPKYKLNELSQISETFNKMAFDLKESLSEKQRLSLIAEQSSDSIIMQNLKDKISFWNDAAEGMFNYKEKEIIGCSILKIFPENLHKNIKKNISKLNNLNQIENYETLGLTKMGDFLDISLSASPLVEPMEKKPIGYIYIIRDFTERKLVETKNKELEKNKTFTKLIQTRLEQERRSISRELHDELGQCVTAIKTIGTATINQVSKKEKVKENVKTIVSVASHIYDIVHNMIKKLRPTGLDHLGLSATLNDAIQTWSERNTAVNVEKDISSNIDQFSEEINITIYRVIQECLTNISRHSYAKNVSIKLLKEISINDEEQIKISVIDDGIGLKNDDLEKLANFGIMGMKERILSLGGTFKISNRADKTGVLVYVLINLRKKNYD